MLQCSLTRTVDEVSHGFDKRFKGECRAPDASKVLRQGFLTIRPNSNEFGGFWSKLADSNSNFVVSEMICFERFEFFGVFKVESHTMWPYMCLCCGLFVPTQFQFECYGVRDVCRRCSKKDMKTIVEGHKHLHVRIHGHFHTRTRTHTLTLTPTLNYTHTLCVCVCVSFSLLLRAVAVAVALWWRTERREETNRNSHN